MRRNLIFFTSLFLFLCTGVLAYGQESVGDTNQPDSLQSKPKTPPQIGFSIDYGKLLAIPLKSETKVEAGIDFTFWGKLRILTEAGYGNLTPDNAIVNGSYESEGIYARGGLLYGGEILPKSWLFLGFTAGYSQFSDNGTVLIESEVFESFEETFERTDLTSLWYEFVMVTEQEFSKNLFLGAKFRLRFLNNFENNFEPEVYSIPGFGRTFDNTVPVFNLYFKYQITL